MTKTDDLVSRVSQLEETVSHLTTHHDEHFLMVHDDVSRDTCDRLFNLNLRQRTRGKVSKGKGIKRRTT